MCAVCDLACSDRGIRCINKHLHAPQAQGKKMMPSKVDSAALCIKLVASPAPVGRAFWNVNLRLQPHSQIYIGHTVGTGLGPERATSGHMSDSDLNLPVLASYL